MKKIFFICLLAMVGIIGLLHYFTPGHLILFHDTYRRISYFPIVIGAILYGVRGGAAMALLSCISFVPHLFMFWYQGAAAYYSELSEILFYLAAGLVIGFISSRENRLREKYQRLSENLSRSYQRLHDQAEQLVQAEKELGQARKLSTLGHVSASLAHEIKNPLASIKGAAEILAEEVPQAHPKHEFVEIMRSEISRLNSSVEDVLAYCRGQQARGREKPVHLSLIMDKVVQLVAGGLGEKSIELTCEPVLEKEKGKNRGGSPDYGPRTDEAAMTQVLLNLILNAGEAVAGKGGIRIRQRRIQAGWQIEVDDTGPGVEKEKYDKIFQSFVSFKEGGTGLGLSISRKIVERLGGSIEVGSSDLGGARFTVVLPMENTGKEEV